jgi:hypothetical protein
MEYLKLAFCLLFGVPLALGLKIAWAVNYGISGREINRSCVLVALSGAATALAINFD